MYHFKKKNTRKVKRRTGRVNKKNNRKRVTKKIKLSRKKLNKLNKKNKRRRRSVKRGGELNDDSIPASHTMGGGEDGLDDHEQPGQNGGSRCMAGGNTHEEEEQIGGTNSYLMTGKQKRGGNSDEVGPDEVGPAVGGNNNDEEQIGGMYGYKIGGKNRLYRGGNGCPCGVV